MKSIFISCNIIIYIKITKIKISIVTIEIGFKIYKNIYFINHGVYT